CISTYIMVQDRTEGLMIGVIWRTAKETVIVLVKKDDLRDKKYANAEFARDIYSLPVAVITASFPYRKQIEAFQEALRVRSMDDLRVEPGAFPRFLGFNVERREIVPKKTGWQPLDLLGRDSAYVGLVALTQNEFEREPEDWKTVQVPGLAMR